MSKYFSLVILFVCASLNVFGCNKENNDQQQTSATYSSTQEENKAPDFSLVSTDGKKINLSDYKGKIVILDFWATWCGPCRRGIPDLVSIQKTYGDKVIVIGISLDDDRTKNDVVPFLKEYEVNYPVVYGTSEVVMNYGGIRAIPTSFIIDQKGNVVDKYMGLVSKEIFVGRIKDLSGS
ncbi:MAG TPA: TlpA disulfide reductase family protein [Ignavibacteriaceae bacterium]|nr:TlpA disulfide reductase family protein [Ignavibacteriaceae bacterium]